MLRVLFEINVATGGVAHSEMMASDAFEVFGVCAANFNHLMVQDNEWGRTDC